MPKGHWSSRYPAWVIWAVCAVFLALAVYAVGFGLAEQRRYVQEANQAAYEYATDAAYQAYNPCRISPLAQLDKCLADAQREYELKRSDNRRDYANLVAQRQSALWTSIVGLTAITGMILSIAGVYLVFTTFRETRKANRIAERSLRAAASSRRADRLEAQRQRKIDQESTERQDRAYIAVQPGGVHKFIRVNEPSLAIGHVVIKNVGSMAAKNVASFVTMEVVNKNTTQPFPIHGDPGAVERAIQVGDEMRLAADNDLPEVDIVANPNVHVFVWGVVYYDDGFGNRRFTRFCHRYPGARVQYDEIPPVPDSMKNLARYMPRPFADELIPAKYARHHEHGNDAD